MIWNCEEVENHSFVDIHVIVHVLDKVKKKFLTQKKKNLEVYDDNGRNISCCRTRIDEEEKRFSK